MAAYAGWGVVLVLVFVLTGCGTADAASPADDGVAFTVTRIVDGDTVRGTLSDGTDVTVRVLGIDTPETVKPRTPVECGGREASAFAKSVLTRRPVRLVTDPTQDRADRYGRILGYLRFGGLDYSVEAARAGVARAYVYDRPAAAHAAIAAAETEARAAGRGGWGSCGWAS